MKYRLRLAGRCHRPPTGRPRNEKEAKGLASFTGRAPVWDRQRPPSVHRWGWKQAGVWCPERGRKGSRPAFKARGVMVSQASFEWYLYWFPVAAVTDYHGLRGLKWFCISFFFKKNKIYFIRLGGGALCLRWSSHPYPSGDQAKTSIKIFVFGNGSFHFKENLTC